MDVPIRDIEINGCDGIGREVKNMILNRTGVTQIVNILFLSFTSFINSGWGKNSTLFLFYLFYTDTKAGEKAKVTKRGKTFSENSLF